MDRQLKKEVTMKIEDLMYNELMLDDMDTARMLDLLLARLFGQGAYQCVRSKRTGIVSFKFWSTESEYHSIVDAIEHEINHWDLEYEELLDKE
jgi:hypothetical protein